MSLFNLEQKLNRQKSRIGLVGAPLKLREVADAKEPLTAHIDPSDWHIEITVKEEYQPVRDKKTEAYVETRKMTAPLEKICQDILFHECGHWELPRGTGKGCPFDIPYHDQIKEAVDKELKKHDKESYTGYIANMFEDVLDNLNCRQYTDHAGQVLFWNEQGMTHGKFEKVYDAFVKLNLALWGDKHDNALISRWQPGVLDRIQTGKAAKEIMNGWNISRPKNPEQLKNTINTLYTKSRWPYMAQKFAVIMAPFLDKVPEQMMFGAGNQGEPDDEDNQDSQGGSGDGHDSREKKNGEGSGNNTEKKNKKKKGRSAFDMKLDAEEGKEKAAHARYIMGRGPATNKDSFPQLDSLYRSLARDVPVEINTFTEGYTFPLVPFGKEQFDPEEHDLATRALRIGLQEDGSVGLNVNKGWIETNESYKLNIRTMPNFRLALIDSSGSMKEAADNSRDVGNTSFIPWGDNSKYHYALLGYYGIEQFLQRQHIAPYVDSGVVNFSGETRKKIGKDSHKILLEPQWGGTELDIDKVKEHFAPDSFILSLSDGAIDNWSGIKEDYIMNAKQAAYAHIQLGGKNEFSTDLEKAGLPVYYVTKGEDLTKLMVKVAGDRYKSYGVRR